MDITDLMNDFTQVWYVGKPNEPSTMNVQSNIMKSAEMKTVKYQLIQTTK